jgi:hypothetical protein
LKIFALKHVSQVNAASPRNASMKTEHLQIPTTIFFTTIPTTIKKTLELSFKKNTGANLPTSQSNITIRWHPRTRKLTGTFARSPAAVKIFPFLHYRIYLPPLQDDRFLSRPLHS